MMLVVFGYVYWFLVWGWLVIGFDEVFDVGVWLCGLMFVVVFGVGVVVLVEGVVCYVWWFWDYGMIVIIDYGDGWISLIIGFLVMLLLVGVWVVVGSVVGVVVIGEELCVIVELCWCGWLVDVVVLIG